MRPPRLHGQSTGLFATRTPHRPSPIGLSVVKLEKVHAWGKKRYLIVSSRYCWLVSVLDTDIVDGSPILDIKPYLPSFDRIDDAFVPQWVMSKAEQRDVHFSDVSVKELEELKNRFIYYNTSEEMKAVLTQVLSADVSKRSDRRVSEFEFDCLSVLFSVQGNVLTVEHIMLTSEYEKVKRHL